MKNLSDIIKKNRYKILNNRAAMFENHNLITLQRGNKLFTLVISGEYVSKKITEAFILRGTAKGLLKDIRSNVTINDLN